MKTGKKKTRGRIGSRLDDWLEEEGLLEECTAVAVKRGVARQLEQANPAEGPGPEPP